MNLYRSALRSNAYVTDGAVLYKDQPNYLKKSFYQIRVTNETMSEEPLF